MHNNILKLSIIVHLLLLLCSRGIGGEFQFDDFAWIHAPVLTGGEPHVPGRPLQSLMMHGIWMVWGLNPLPFKVISLLLHSLVILTLLKIADTLERGYWGVTLFAVHPVLVSTVCYPVQSSVILAALWGSLAFLSYLNKKYIPMLLFLGFAALSKQVAWVFPLVILLYEWLIVRKRSVTIPLLLISATALYVVITRDLHSQMPLRAYNAWERVCTQCLIIGDYLKMVLLPHVSRYALDHDITHTSNPMFILGLTLLGGLGVSISNNYGKFAILGLVVLLVPEFTIMNLELMFEHRLYIPLAFLCVFVPRTCAPYQRKLYSIAACFLAIVSIQYQCIFRTQIGLWEHNLKKYPNNFRAHLNLALLTYKKEPLRALYHMDKLKHCRDRKGGKWSHRANYVYSASMRPLIIEAINRFDRSIAPQP